VVAVVCVPSRGQQTQPAPGTLLGEREQTWERRLRDDDEVDVLPGVLGGAVELVEQRRARRARALLQRQQRGLADRRPGGAVAWIAGEHEAVDHEAVLARLEQLRQFHVRGGAVRTSALEHIVVRNWPARRQRPP